MHLLPLFVAGQEGTGRHSRMEYLHARKEPTRDCTP